MRNLRKIEFLIVYCIFPFLCDDSNATLVLNLNRCQKYETLNSEDSIHQFLFDFHCLNYQS